MKRLLLALALLVAPVFGAAAPLAAQEIDRAPKVNARLVAEGEAAPGGSVWVALEEKIRPSWHTYWINPGDAGDPTSIDWTLPAGWKAGDIVWPYPKRLPVGPLMDYGYENKVWLLSPIAVPANAKPGTTVTLKAAAHWLVCQQVCIPEDAVLEVPVKVGAGGADPAVAKDFAAARAKLPADSPWKTVFAR